ncbi:RNA-protein complex protein Nop10 [archaeon]|nr:MAG: RNA-protein complex protein Nop10 [archaeon]
MRIRKCPKCNIYTFKDTCIKCKGPTSSPEPPKFSPQDKYGKYRRMMIRQ